MLSISHRRIKGQAYRWAIGPEPEQTAPNWTVSPPTPLLSRLPSHSVRAVGPATLTPNCRAADAASPRRRTSPRMDGPSASAADSLATCAGTVRPSRVFSRRRGDPAATARCLVRPQPSPRPAHHGPMTRITSSVAAPISTSSSPVFSSSSFYPQRNGESAHGPRPMNADPHVPRADGAGKKKGVVKVYLRKGNTFHDGSTEHVLQLNEEVCYDFVVGNLNIH